jgi:4-amino-4-deoxy-L-arabinose transferase-like glycosyltransferase
MPERHPRDKRGAFHATTTWPKSPVARGGPRGGLLACARVRPLAWISALRRVPPELLVLLLGFALRFSFVTELRASYDLVDHQRYTDWFRDHWTLPSMRLSRLTYGPPLYYLLAGKIRAMGQGWPTLIGWSAVLGTLRLALLWWALRRLLPTSTLGRVAALSLAAVLPAAVHIDGMVNNESLSMLACWATMACWLRFGGASDDARLRWGLATGVLLAIALLTKFSAVMLVIAAVGAAVLEWGRRATPWVAGVLVAVVLVSPYYARNREQTGLVFPTAFELLDAGAISQQVRDTPVYARRPLTFYWQFEPAVWERPYWSTGAGQFWSTLVAVTYADYSAYHFSPRTEAPPPRGWSEATLARAGRSVLGGTVIGVITAGAWLVCLVLALWRREAPWAAMLVVSALAIVGQLFFATKYPVDHYGVIKGTYIQFGAAPLYVCFGLAVSRRGVLGRALAVVGLGALALVAYYTLTSRLGLS